MTQYLRPITDLLTTRNPRRWIVAVAAAVCLGLAAPALAAPAGDEYLPKVPKAAGKGVVANPDQGPGASVVAPTVRGSASSEGGGKSSDGGGNAKKGTNQAGPSQNASAPADSSGDGGSAILSPIVLLMIAGVIAAAAGMTLRRRQGRKGDPEDGETQQEPEQVRNARPTPDGEIV